MHNTTITADFIEGAAQIIKWEQALEEGKNIDSQVNDILEGFKSVPCSWPVESEST